MRFLLTKSARALKYHLCLRLVFHILFIWRLEFLWMRFSRPILLRAEATAVYIFIAIKILRRGVTIFSSGRKRRKDQRNPIGAVETPVNGENILTLTSKTSPYNYDSDVPGLCDRKYTAIGAVYRLHDRYYNYVYVYHNIHTMCSHFEKLS